MDWFNRASLKQAFIEVIRPLKRHIQGQLEVIDEVYDNLNNLAEAVNELDDTANGVRLAYDEETKYLSMTTDRTITYDSTNKIITLS